MHDDAPTPDQLARADTVTGTPVIDRLARDDVKARLFGEPTESPRIGRYAVLRRIGAGGMGVVYSAYDDELDRKVAIKLVRGDHVGEQTVARVRREAQALARLSHPNVVQVYEVDRFHGQAYVAMEFVQGQTLRAYQEAPGRTTAELVAAYVQAGRGLAAAHAAGLVHRDFKPDNALVGDDGRVRVVDFGLARRDEAELERTDRTGPPGHDPTSTRVVGPLTASGAVIGTPAYMAPEQFDGQPADVRSDVFSFCVSLYEALYGRRPFPGQNALELRTAIAEGHVETPDDARGVPAAIRRALLRGLAEHPAARWPAMEPLLAALTADPGRRLRVAAAAVLLFMLAGTGVYALLQRAEAQRAEDLARASARASAAESAAETASATASRLERVGLARRLAARATDERERDPAAGLLLALEAVEATRRAGEPATVEAEQALRDALDTVRSVPLRAPDSAAVARVALSPDGRWAAVRDTAGTVRLWDIHAAPSLSAVLPPETPDVEHPERWALSFTPDSRILLNARSRGGAERIAVDALEQPLPELDTGGPARDLVLDGARGLAVVDGGAALIDLSAGTPARPLAGLVENVRDASFSPDGERLLIIAADGSARVWSTRDGTLLRQLRRPGAIRRARGAWSPDGESVVLVGPDRVAQVFRAAGGPPRTLRGHVDEVYAAGFTSEGAVLTLSADDTLRRWEDSGDSVRVDLVQHAEAVGGARLLPGGDLLLGTPYGGALWLWSTSERGAPMLLFGHERSVTEVRVDAAGDRLLTAAHGDPAPRLWQWGDDPHVLRGHEGLIERLSWSPDGTRLLSAAIDGTARVWSSDGASQVLRRHREDSSIAAAWRPDGRIVATAGSDGAARLWRVDGEQPAAIASLIGHVVKDSAVMVVPVGPGRPPRSPAPEPADTPPGIRDVAWSPTGDRLALAGEDGVVHLWDVDPGGIPSRVEKLSLGSWSVELVRFAPRGDLLACAGEDRDVRLIALADGPGAPQAVGGHSGPIRAVAFAADGRRLATASDDGTARVFSLDPTPTLLRELVGHARGLWSIELTADGTRALTAGADGTARIWHIDDPSAPPTILLGHAQAVLSASFSPDATRILTTSADGTARIWRNSPDSPDRNTWTSVVLPHAGTSRPGELDRNVWAGVWSPDGTRVATAAADGIVRQFPVDLAPLIVEACARAGRNLSRETFNQVFGDRPPVATCPQWPPP